jgi:hypothetical protein
MAERWTRELAGLGGSQAGGLGGRLVAAKLIDEELRRADTMGAMVMALPAVSDRVAPRALIGAHLLTSAELRR